MYQIKTKVLDIPRNNRTFTNFAISETPNYDLDFFDLKIGSQRVGKSMLNIIDLIEQVQFRLRLSYQKAIEYILEHKLLNTNFVYQQRQLRDFYKNINASRRSWFTFDDAIFNADRRNAMQKTSIELTEVLLGVANYNHNFNALIQNLTDLDLRLTNKSNTIRLLTARGQAYIFSAPRNFAPIIKDSYGFEYIIQHPYLLGGEAKAENTLSKMGSFIFKINWNDISNAQIWAVYKGIKEQSQNAGFKKHADAYEIAEVISGAIDPYKIAKQIEKQL